MIGVYNLEFCSKKLFFSFIFIFNISFELFYKINLRIQILIDLVYFLKN